MVEVRTETIVMKKGEGPDKNWGGKRARKFGKNLFFLTLLQELERKLLQFRSVLKHSF